MKYIFLNLLKKRLKIAYLFYEKLKKKSGKDMIKDKITVSNYPSQEFEKMQIALAINMQLWRIL